MADNRHRRLRDLSRRRPAPERAVDAARPGGLHQQRHLGADAGSGQHARVRAPRSRPRRLKAPRPARPPAARWAGRSACSPASARWRSRASGRFIAAGPIVGALAGLGAGGAVGGLVGALVGMGLPEYEAKRYEGRVQRRRRAAVGAHRDVRSGEHRQADPRAHRRRGHLVVGRSERRRPGRDPHRHAIPQPPRASRPPALIAEVRPPCPAPPVCGGAGLLRFPRPT